MSRSTDRTARLPDMLRRILLVSLSLFAFVATTHWVRGWVPDLRKLEWYEQEGEGVDVLFLGSSHVYRQMDPAIFDEVRGAEAKGQRALNIGMLGMELFEEGYMLRRLLEDPQESLKWIIVEAHPFSVSMQNENDFGRRRIGWHDTWVTWRAIKGLQDADLPDEERRSLFDRHVEHWWRRTINIGHGVEMVGSWFDIDRKPFGDSQGLGRNRDGYFPLEPKTAKQRNLAMRQAFLKRPGEMHRGVQGLSEVKEDLPPDPRLLSLVRELEDMAAEQDVNLVWWIHPNLKRYHGWRTMLEEGDIRYLIAFDDPARYPDFYRMKMRFDLYHLNRQGAEMLTEELAREFLHQTREAADR